MMRRRGFMAGVAASGLLLGRPSAARPAEALLDKARRLAARPFAPNAPPLPPPFADLTYDAYRGIRPVPGRAALLDHGPDFAFDLLPPGLFFPDPVRIDVDDGSGPAPVDFSPDLFAFDDRYFADVPGTAPGAGFSGLRLRHPLNAPGRLDEVLVLQGASYFRAIGQDMVYGLSARGGRAWHRRPSARGVSPLHPSALHPASGGAVRIEGVIDSPSLAGHLDMTLRPGAQHRHRYRGHAAAAARHRRYRCRAADVDVPQGAASQRRQRRFPAPGA